MGINEIENPERVALGSLSTEQLDGFKKKWIFFSCIRTFQELQDFVCYILACEHWFGMGHVS